MSAEFIEKIEDYLDGKISREELQQLADAEGVENLEQEIQWLQDSQIAVEAAGLRDQLQAALPKSQAPKVRRLKPVRTILAIAATLLLLVIAYFGFLRDDTPSLYAKYEYVDPGLPVLMSQSEDHLFYDAMTYYSEGNYAVTEEKLQQIRDQYAGSDTLLYYLGASQLYQGESQEAQESLQQVVATENSSYAEKAEWLLVLSALRAENEAEAQRLVQQILDNPDHAFFAEAENLQEELNQ